MPKVNNITDCPYLVRGRRIRPDDGLVFTNWPAADRASAEVFAEAARETGRYLEVRIIYVAGGES